MNILKLRLSKGMTQQQLAEQLGIGRTAVAMWESGKALPSAAKLPEIARVLGCSIDELLKVNG